MDKTIMAREMQEVRPNPEQKFTGCGRNEAGGTRAGARTGGSARGEGAAKVTMGEVVR